jgi:hypothetical protein
MYILGAVLKNELSEIRHCYQERLKITHIKDGTTAKGLVEDMSTQNVTSINECRVSGLNSGNACNFPEGDGALSLDCSATGSSSLIPSFSLNRTFTSLHLLSYGHVFISSWVI